MNYLKFAKQSTHSGTGIRCVLYVTGCRNKCPGCQNPETWCFTNGQPYTEELEQHIIEQVNKPYIAGLTLCGGEPMEPENQEILASLAARVKAETGKTVWCYTGYEYEDLIEGGRKYCTATAKLLENIDVLIVGKYEQDQKDISTNNLWRGSKNQRVLDLAETLKKGSPIMMSGIPNNK